MGGGDGGSHMEVLIWRFSYGGSHVVELSLLLLCVIEMQLRGNFIENVKTRTGQRKYTKH